MTDPADLSATEAARRLRDGSLTATALTEALLDRVAAREPVLRAFAWLDQALARRQAAALDAAPRRGPLPLAGMALRGEGCAGYRRPAIAIWLADLGRASAARRCRLRRAGPAGRRGHPRQDGDDRIRHPPSGPDRQPAQPGAYAGRLFLRLGGRGGGGFFHAGFGTQTAGSIIRPAAFCGAVGFKPSYGTLHRAGMKVMSELLDTIGVITRTAGDCGPGHGRADRARLRRRRTPGPAAAPRLASAWARPRPRRSPRPWRCSTAWPRPRPGPAPRSSRWTCRPPWSPALPRMPLVMNGELRRGAGLGAGPRPRRCSRRGCGSGWTGAAPSARAGAGGRAGGLRRGAGRLRRCRRAASTPS